MGGGRAGYDGVAGLKAPCPDGHPRQLRQRMGSCRSMNCGDFALRNNQGVCPLSAPSKYRMGTWGMHTEVQEQCKQHMPTKGAAHSVERQRRTSRERLWEGEGGKGRGGGVGGAAGPALNMGKFGERGRRVKKSQQESSPDDRRNLISKMHKSSSEGRRTMGTKGASVRVNTDLLLAIKWIGPSC